ncbi:biopolymer transporter ExbD [candidate division KSB1 bacterium]|nr:biopolymer transporter ExbD [candidate division KSB1 bacterium]
MQIGDQEGAGLNEINLTSLIDVALVLVVIFMVMTPMIMQSQIMVSAPKVGKAAGSQKQMNVRTEVHLSRTGGILLNDEPVPPPALYESLRQQLSQSKNKLVVVSADEQVVHERVVTVLDVARQAGAKELSIVKRKL